MRLNAISLGSLDERVEVRARHGTFDCVTEEPAFSTEDKRTDGVLAAVVVQRYLAMSEEHDQLRPLTESVVHGLAQQALWQHFRRDRLEPGVELLYDRG